MKMKTVKSCLAAVIALAAALVSTVASAWPTAKLGLPAGYTRLDSITSTGTQYINTGVSASQGTVMDFSFRSGLISARDVMYFGSDKANVQYRFTFQPRVYNDSWYIVLNRQAANGLVEDADYRLVVDYLLANRVTLTHGDVEQAFTQLDGTSGVIYLFSGRDPADGSSVGKSAYTFYEMKLWEHVKVSNKWTEDMTAQRDFVPARRDSDGAIGLCDAVNGVFYPNEGTGEFIAGPVTSLGEFTVGGLGAETFDGSAIPEPKPVVTDSSSGARLTEGQDYTLSYLNNHGAGTATVVVTGVGSYAGTVAKTDFTILCESFADDWLTTADTTCQKYVDDDARIYVFTNVESAVTATMCSDCMLEQVLLVGGGGAGGSYKGGGGGAGGVVHYPAFVQALATGTELSMSVGAGASAPTAVTQNSSNGSASTLTVGGQSWSALGGGGGGRQGYKAMDGFAGASGGGAAYGNGTGGAGTDGQGFAGGSASGGNYSPAAGGGGAGGEGTSVTSATEIGNGGPGVEISITGGPVVYGGGGGAGGASTYQNMGNNGPNDCGLGGLGGGGRGGIVSGGEPGTDGLGGGGGGGGLYYNNGQLGGRGGNGTIILRFVRKGMAVTDIPGPRPYTGSAVEPKVTVTTLEGDVLVEGEDYEVSYSDNVECGTATATVKGLGGYSAFVIEKKFVIARIYLVTPKAAGGGDGCTWDSAMTLSEAETAATANPGEIWLKTGTITYKETSVKLVPTAEIAVRGGFAGTEGAAAERPAGLKSTIDGENTNDGLTLENVQPVTIERIVFTRGQAHGLAKTGAGALTIEDCEFNGNGGQLMNDAGKDVSGRGLYADGGTTKPPLTVRRCLFAGNVVADFVTGGKANAENGTAMYATQVALQMFDTTFVTNGIPFDKAVDVVLGSNGSSRFNYYGAALYVSKAKDVQLEGCRFVANRVPSFKLSKDYRHGSLIAFVQDSNMSVTLRNCLIAGNSVIGPSADSDRSGLIYFSGNSAKPVLFDRCTFAYNLMRSPNALIGPSTGAMTVRNSVFFGNVGDSLTSAPLDVGCGTGGVTLEYSMLAGTGVENIDASVTQGAGLVTGDPQFVTTADDFLALIENDNPSLGRMTWPYRFKPEKIAELVNIDCHLRSAQGYVDNAGEQHTAPGVRSLAIDAGDPADEAWVNEPGENGGRLNAGAYAGTAEASQTPKAGQPEIDPEGVTVTYPNEWTQPQIAFTMGGEGVYLATVRISCGTGMLEQAWSTVLTGVGNGDVVTWKLPGYTAEGELITYSIVVESESGTLDPVVKQSTAQGTCPPWAGKGGGANVMHVRSGAEGSGDGSDWSNASPDICAAIDRLTSDKTEIWVAGDTPVDAEQLVRAHTVLSDVVFRGGFTGVENALAERPDGTKTVFDQRNAALGLQVDLAANVTARMERFRFVNSGTRALKVTAAAGAALTLEDCEIEDNVMGVSVAGANDAAVAVKNCLFAGNLACEAHPGNCGGRALYVDSCKRLTIDDTLFASNGITAAYADALGMTAGGSGPILYLYQTKVTARNVRFIGNRLRRGTGGGGIVLAEYADYQSPLRVANSAFTNCLWMANEERNVGIRSNNGGGMVFYPNKTHDPEVAVRPLDFVNCTFAFNLTIGSGDDYKDMLDRTTSAGLNVFSCDARVRNCVFYGNMLRDDTYCGSDIFSGGSATFDVDYSLFAGEGTNWVSGTNLVIGSHNVYGSPRFVTTDAEFLATIEKSETYEAGSVSRWRYTSGSNRPKFSASDDAQAAIAHFNVHVRGGSGYVDETTGEIVRTGGRTSLAVDAGDPDAPYGREPSPNGGRVNLGFYGNTPWATMSKGGMLILVK